MEEGGNELKIKGCHSNISLSCNNESWDQQFMIETLIETFCQQSIFNILNDYYVPFLTTYPTYDHIRTFPPIGRIVSIRTGAIAIATINTSVTVRARNNDFMSQLEHFLTGNKRKYEFSSNFSVKIIKILRNFKGLTNLQFL